MTVGGYEVIFFSSLIFHHFFYLDYLLSLQSPSFSLLFSLFTPGANHRAVEGAAGKGGAGKGGGSGDHQEGAERAEGESLPAAG